MGRAGQQSFFKALAASLSLIRVLGYSSSYNRIDLLIEFMVYFSQRWRLLIQVAAHNIVLGLSCILTAKRWPASQHLIQHTSETIDICTVINPIRSNLLRAHIFRRTNVRPKLGVSLLSHDQSNSEINEICMLIWPH